MAGPGKGPRQRQADLDACPMTIETKVTIKKMNRGTPSSGRPGTNHQPAANTKRHRGASEEGKQCQST
jgi:hypothetical protein